MIDINEAPEGYIAVPASPDVDNACALCAFNAGPGCARPSSGPPCLGDYRRDRTEVYFRSKSEEPRPNGTAGPVPYAPAAADDVLLAALRGHEDPLVQELVRRYVAARDTLDVSDGGE